MDRPVGIRLNDTDRGNIDIIIGSGAAVGPTDAIRVGLSLAAVIFGVTARSRKIVRKIVELLAA